MFSWRNCKMLRRGKGTASMMASSRRLCTKEKKTRCQQPIAQPAKTSVFSSLFAALDVSRGGTSATQLQKFHTDDANQCFHNKSGSHAVPNINLSNFSPAAKSEEKQMFSQATNSWIMEEPGRWDRTSACKGARMQPLQFIFWSHLAHPERWRHMSDRPWHWALRGHRGPMCYRFQ